MYDIKEYEQCVCLGTIKDIATFLECSTNSIRSYITHRKKGERSSLLRKRYGLAEIKEDGEEILIKSNKEIFKELLKKFGYKPVDLNKEMKKFEIFDDFKWELKGKMNKVMAKEEEWKKIPDFEYSISNYARIRNDKNNKIKATRIKNYIKVVDLYKNGKRYMLNVVRMEAHLFIRPVLKGERIKHIDGDSRNNFIDNLEIVSM
ncbi:NUMOD4 domain-containing protein [Faecalibacillus faecis]|uniref:NUMOD4 domain-containing protein n=1 Tax=Faecalibacillus faecis TaxID=1982628 RepID=UPI00386585D0